MWPTLVDPPQLENVLLDACINTRDAMPGGRFTVEVGMHVMTKPFALEAPIRELIAA